MTATSRAAGPHRRYRLDPELEPSAQAHTDLELSDVAAARRALDEGRRRRPAPRVPKGVQIEERILPGPSDNSQLRAYVVSPRGNLLGAAPALLHLHGGGFALGRADADLPWAIAVANRGGVVVSLDYRLAPEHPYPAAVSDAYAALSWMAHHGSEVGIDTSRIAIGGLSAGGGIAAGVALLARDRAGPALCAQILDIPELDDRLESASMLDGVDAPIWNSRNARLSWSYYLNGSDREEVSAYAAPSRATDLTGLPPAFIAVCENDPLRDEGLAYANALMRARVPVDLHLYAGTFHGSAALAPGAAISRRMLDDRLFGLMRAFGRAIKTSE